ncbi:RDD family protein [Kocuria tytonis]|uniref:RDD family protein n=1 Tax=Kocuria tytonis TaxID=2054280 RepID=A0A495A9Z4_9MICC|nr:RDD family protein [Kocuria tytonis]RKQ36260.1 RDD family protein [Kocuria tytonis]
MISRQDMGSWLDGTPQDGRGHPGRRLGRPPEGPGSVGSFFPRVVALVIDWAVSALVATAFLSRWNGSGLMTLLVFFVLSALMVGFFGRTPGHWIMGLQVQTMNGRPAGFGRAAVRSLLICAVIPPLVVDEDHRGLHDRAVDTILVRVR